MKITMDDGRLEKEEFDRKISSMKAELIKGQEAMVSERKQMQKHYGWVHVRE